MDYKDFKVIPVTQNFTKLEKVMEIIQDTVNKVGYPITSKKIKKAGLDATDFLKELKARLEKAEDKDTIKNQDLLKAFFEAVEKL